MLALRTFGDRALPRFSRAPCSRALCFSATLLALLHLAMPAASQGQPIGAREYPPQEYYLAFRFLDEGDFATALDAFRSAGRAGLRSTEGRWVDSICYHTMMGECLYQMGDLASALEQYNSALNLFVAYHGWMIRVDFAPGIEPSRRARRPPTWGASTRRAIVGQFVDRYPILQGRFDNEIVLQLGGIVSLPEYMLVNAHEIARCTALAISRRRELMGSACQHTPLTRQVLQALSTRPTRPNHWSQAWIDVQLGMAAAAAGKDEQAVNDLGKGILAGGRFDHPLTPLALLELGKLAVENSQFATASNFFAEASLSAAIFEQHTLVEESLRLASQTHMATQGQGVYAALAPANGWARRQSKFLEASMLVEAAENAAVHNLTGNATGLIDQARRRMVRTEMPPSAVGARLAYVTALASYQAGNLKAGDTAFASLMQFQQRGSRRLFEISLVDGLFNTGMISERVANGLYTEVLREPTATDWATSPVETQSVMMAGLAGPMENWLRTALLRREPEKALEIADLIRRRRFYSTLPMGGRLLSLRWVLAAPTELLSKRAVLQRQALLDRFPGYAGLVNRANTAEAQLRAMALVPDEETDAARQQKSFQQLDEASSDQEKALREMALHRAPADLIFPPPLNFAEAQARLEPGQFVVSYLVTSQGTYVFRFGRDSYSPVEQLEAPAAIEKEIVQLLRGLGLLDKNYALSAEALVDQRWREVAARLFGKLNPRGLPEGLRELILVPDGSLWYLPFEALQVPDAAGSSNLISRYRVRYAPTVALAFPGGRKLSPAAQTAIVAGRLFPRDDTEISAAAATELTTLLPNTSRLPTSRPVPGDLFAALCDRLIVYHDVESNAANPYGWSPIPFDRTRDNRPLSRWMSLPWGGPQQIVLPGFHTAAENGLKRGGNGSEIFLSLCGLMATGADTILISRWRPGGQSAYDLVREFVQELPHTTAADAWQRSVQLAADTDLMLAREPRVAAEEFETAPKSEHPFFWAGYLLVDRGGMPK